MMKSQRTFQQGDQLDRFTLERLLGEGAFGQVWLAIDEGDYGFRKRVALKILTDFHNPKRLNALLREARICASLNHPHVVDVFGVKKLDDAAFIVMEYVEGETLRDLWHAMEDNELRFPRSVIVDIGISVAEALHHAWTVTDADGLPLTIVHRDLKPANVMVSNKGQVKVADFGIAKVADDVTQTRTGKLKGTPSYLPPELWAGSRDFQPTMDLFSLGVILWEMATGRRFYGKVTIGQIFGILKDRSPAHEADHLHEYFPQLQPIVERLLQRAPERRFQGGLQVAEALRSLRHDVGTPGDLLQFSRLVRASRVQPDERRGSLAAMPVIGASTDDWGALMAVALGKTSSSEEQDELARQLHPPRQPTVTPLTVKPGPPPEVPMAETFEVRPVHSPAPAPTDSSGSAPPRQEDFWEDPGLVQLGAVPPPPPPAASRDEQRPRGRYALSSPRAQQERSLSRPPPPPPAPQPEPGHPALWALVALGLVGLMAALWFGLAA